MYLIDQRLLHLDFSTIIANRDPSLTKIRLAAYASGLEVIIFSLYQMVYFIIFGWISKGQSLGKYCLRIRSVNANTKQPKFSFGWILLQNFVKAIFLFLFFDLILEVFNAGDEKIYRITQKWANIRIIKLPKKISQKDSHDKNNEKESNEENIMTESNEK